MQVLKLCTLFRPNQPRIYSRRAQLQRYRDSLPLLNSPPGGAINYTLSPAVGKNYENHLIGIQLVVVDHLDRLWILDTIRAAMVSGANVPSSVCGRKINRR